MVQCLNCGAKVLRISLSIAFDMNEPLRRTRADRKIGGVVSGVARFYGLDATPLRILIVILAACWGTGILAYLIAWALIPEE